MNYRDKLYGVYTSKHLTNLYGEVNLKSIEGQFPAWRSYYGRFLPKDKSAHIIDLGCGNGGFVHFLNSMGYKNASGIDRGPEQVEEAKRLGIENVRLSGIVEFLKDKSNIYDVIFARDVIEHFTKDEVINLFMMIYRALKPNGLFVIQTPNAESPFAGRYRYYDFTHEVSFTSSSLNQVLTAAGFGGASFHSTGPVPKGIKSALRFILWKGIEGALRLYMLAETGSPKGIFTQNLIASAKKEQ